MVEEGLPFLDSSITVLIGGELSAELQRQAARETATT